MSGKLGVTLVIYYGIVEVIFWHVVLWAKKTAENSIQFVVIKALLSGPGYVLIGHHLN